MSPLTAGDLIAFEKRVIEAFGRKEVKGPVHLSGGNEEQLIEIFKDISPEDWVATSYRNHYHALLHGVPEEWLFSEILAGRSMNIFNPAHRFVTSAIVGGMVPIAVGVAAALKRQGSGRRVWCFVGDMAQTTGIFAECDRYSSHQDLPITFVVEDNGMSCNSPTDECWGTANDVRTTRYKFRSYTYERQFPHVGIGQFVAF